MHEEDDNRDLQCEICRENFSEENQDTQPLRLTCRCKKTICRGCIIKRLGTTANCPYCNQRWSVRNFVQQCELSTPRDYYGEILAKAATNVNSSPLRLEENLVPLGAGILRDYYLKSLEVVQKDAEARSAEQIHNDNELARQLEEERQRELLRLRQLEEEDAKLAQSLAGTDQRNLNSSSSSSSSSSDNRRKDSNRTSLSGARTTSASSSSSSSGARRSSKPQNNGSSLLTFFAKDEGGGSSSSSSSSSQSSLNNCNSSPAGINENQYPTGTQSSNNECQHQPSSSSGKKRPIDSDPDVILVERSNSNSDSNSIPKSKEQKPLQQVALPENHSHNKRSKQQDKLEQNWVCTKCTFADNPALYLFCDCCSEERQSTNTSSTSSSSSSSSQENISHLAF